jgi:hypothetical protein
MHELSGRARRRMSQFQALTKKVEDLRSTADVFSSVAKDANLIGARFASRGKFTEEQFKAGEDATEAPVTDGQAADEAEDGAPGKSSRLPYWRNFRGISVLFGSKHSGT